MRSRRIRVALCAALFCFIPSALRASQTAQRHSRTGGQANDRYFVSAKAGVVNLVEGRAELQSAEGWRAAAVKDEMHDGDAARTGADGRLEVLLTPGSFLRAGSNAEFEITDTSLERLAIDLRRGSLIVEAVSTGDDKPIVTITTPQTQIAIVRGGVYRVEADAAGSEVIVFKGRALVGSGSLLVKGDRKTVVARDGAASLPAKFDKKQERDEFDRWSRERAEQLAQDNRRLSRRALTASLMGFSALNDPFSGGFGRTGLWVFDPMRGGHTFLPFGWNIRSPYGCNYNTGMAFGNTNAGFFPGRGGNNPAPGVTPIIVGGGGSAGGDVGGNNGGNNGNGAMPQPTESMPHTSQPTPRDSMPSMPTMPDRPMMDSPAPRDSPQMQTTLPPA